MSENPKKSLGKAGIRPKQSLGQNFCIDQNVLRNFAYETNLTSDEWAIEIGPGTGALTEHLAKTGCLLDTIEIDERLEDTLREKFGDNERIHLNFGNAIKVAPKLLRESDRPAVMVGNLPYHLSSPLLIMFLENQKQISRAYITMQLELAERLVAPHGNKTYGSLSVRVQAASCPRIVFKISPNCFFPVPKVTSALVEIDFSEVPKFKPDNEAVFKRVVRAAFAQRRKQLQNCLRALCDVEMVRQALETAGIALTARAESVDVEGFVRLSNVFAKLLSKPKASE
jgi:16S rRNA (adenine1518-N6/adenine1519-N6)-dimethyltransferase